MKRLLAVGILACFRAAPLEAAEARTPYTLMVYMNGTDLESDGGLASLNLRQMMAVGSSAAANVVVETGGTLKWHNRFVGRKATQRWHVQKKSMRRVDDGSLGLRDMGDPNTLADFIAWAVNNYAADRYALVLWNHGGGTIDGFGADQNYDNSRLDLVELDAALAAAKARTGATLELIGFDACLLGTLEYAAKLKQHARYMVASEELEPGEGWDYTFALKILNEDPQTDGKSLGTAVVDGYMAQNRDAHALTLSVIDLGQVDTLLSSLSDLAASVAPTVNTRWPSLSKARDEAERFGRSPDPEGETDMVDVGDWIGKLQKRGMITVEQAAPALDALGQAVVYKRSDEFRSDAQGLSVYFPHFAKDDFAERLTFYRQLGFVAAYTSLIEAYANSMLNYEDKPRLVNAEPRPSTSGGSEHFEIAIVKDDVDKVRQAYSVLGQRQPANGAVRLLAMDNTVSFDESSGVIGYQFDRKWLTLNDRFVSMVYSDRDGPLVTYQIPVRIKQRGKFRDAYLSAQYDTRSGSFDKVRHGQLMPGDFEPGSKLEFAVKAGQRIKPLLIEMREGSAERAFVESKGLTVGRKGLTLRDTDAPAGDYVIGFYVEGVSGKGTRSEHLPFAYQ
jgi:hypothetical protein